jgi:hypothetical protein
VLIRRGITGRLRIVAALALLLLACADILAIDLAGEPGNAVTGAPACSDSENHEDCFCCCRHVIAVPPVELQRAPHTETLVAVALPAFQSLPPASPFHPPRP